MRREYTIELYNRIKSGCDREHQFWLTDWWDNLCAKWDMFWEGVFSGTNRKNFVEIDESAEAILKDVLEYYDYTEKKLKEIFDLEKQASSSYCKGFSSKRDNFVIAHTYLSLMAQAIEPSGNNFTAGNLKKIFSYDSEFFYPDEIDKYIEIAATTRYEYTDKDIKYFTENEENMNYFLDTSVATGSYFSNIKDIDALVIAIFNMFDIAGTTVAKIIDTATDQEKIGYLEDVLSGSAWETATMKENLAATIKEMCANSTYSESDAEDLISLAKDWTGKIKEYGKNWAEFVDMDKRTKEYKNFKKFYEKFGSTEEFLKYADMYGDAVWALFVSYDQNLEIINSVSNVSEGFCSKSFEQAVSELTSEYESNFAMFLNEAKMTTIDQLIKAGKKTALTAVGIELLFGTAEKIIEVTGEVTGLAEKTKGQIKAMTIYNYIGDLENSYKNSFSALQELDPSDDSFATCKKTLENNFSLLKNSYKELFDAMATSEDGVKKNYYSYCSKIVATASMKDANPLDLLRYEEYIKQYGN